MFRDLQIRWRPIIFVGALVATLLWSLILLFDGVSYEILLKSFLRFGIVSFILFLIWRFFTQTAWRWRIFNGWLVTVPYIKGRWVGTYYSSFDQYKTPYKMALEIISQSFFNISCVAFSADSKADGYSARILSDFENRQFKLAYIYHAKRKPSSEILGDEHEGLAVLEIIEGIPRHMNGFYINDRLPQSNKGEISLEFESLVCKGSI